MRGSGQHQPPAVTQPCPADNTSRYVAQQVHTWQHDATVVHTEVAREIAAWWQTPARGDALQAFAGAGLILADLPDAIDKARRTAQHGEGGTPADQDSVAALAAYVAACPGVANIRHLQDLVDDAGAAAADGDSNDDEITALRTALGVALTRWPEIQNPWSALTAHAPHRLPTESEWYIVMDLDTPASSQPSSTTKPAPSINVGDRVINWYDDAIVTYGGPSHDDTFTTLTFGMLGGKAPTLACDVERVAPADIDIAPAADRLAIQKRPRSTMPYGVPGPWLLETPLNEAGRVFRSWHRTKRDTTAMGLRRLAILDWHTARRRAVGSPNA